MNDILDTPLTMTLQFISNVSPEVREMQLKDIKSGIASQEIQYINSDDIIKSPYAMYGSIFLPKSYLILLWATCYFLFRITEEIMDLEMQKKFTGDVGDSLEIKGAYELINWSLTLRETFSSWPEELPSPERNDIFCNDTNALFSYALGYVFFHEYAHLKLNHTGGKNVIEQEKEADAFARDIMMKACTTESKKRNIGIGIGGVGISLLLAIQNGKYIIQSDHPDLDIRLTSSLSNIDISGNNEKYYLLKLLTVGLSAFCQLHKIEIPLHEFETIEDHYSCILKKIDEYKKNN